MGNFVAVFIQQGDIQNLLQLIVRVVADIGFGTLWVQERIALFPDTDGMGFNAGEIFGSLIVKAFMYKITGRSLFCLTFLDKKIIQN